MAYVETFDGASNEFKQVLFGSGTIDIAPVEQYFYTGGFADDDFSVEYAIEYTAGDFYSINTSTGATMRIGATITEGSIPYGPKWNPKTGISYVIIESQLASGDHDAGQRVARHRRELVRPDRVRRHRLVVHHRADITGSVSLSQ